MLKTQESIHPLHKYFKDEHHHTHWDKSLPIVRAMNSMKKDNGLYPRGILDTSDMRLLYSAIQFDSIEQVQEAIWLFSRVRSLESYIKVRMDEVVNTKINFHGESSYSVEAVVGYPMDVFRGARFDFHVDPSSNKITSLWASFDGIIPQPEHHESFEHIDAEDPRRQSHPAIDALFDFLGRGKRRQGSMKYEGDWGSHANSLVITYHGRAIQQPQRIYIERTTHLLSSDGEEHPHDIDEYWTYREDDLVAPSDRCVNIIFERPTKWDDSNLTVVRSIFTLVYDDHPYHFDSRAGWVVQNVRSSLQIIGAGVRPLLSHSIFDEMSSHSTKMRRGTVESVEELDRRRS